MSGVLRHWQQPEWSARALWVFAEVDPYTRIYLPGLPIYILAKTAKVGPIGTFKDEEIPTKFLRTFQSLSL